MCCACLTRNMSTRRQRQQPLKPLKSTTRTQGNRIHTRTESSKYIATPRPGAYHPCGNNNSRSSSAHVSTFDALRFMYVVLCMIYIYVYIQYKQTHSNEPCACTCCAYSMSIVYQIYTHTHKRTNVQTNGTNKFIGPSRSYGCSLRAQASPLRRAPVVVRSLDVYLYTYNGLNRVHVGYIHTCICFFRHAPARRSIALCMVVKGTK